MPSQSEGTKWLKCPVCSKGFRVFRSRIRNRKVMFCSQPCWREALAQTKSVYADRFSQQLEAAA